MRKRKNSSEIIPEKYMRISNELSDNVDPFLQLSNEIIIRIFALMHWNDLLSIDLVCKHFHLLISNHDSLWCTQIEKDFGNTKEKFIARLRNSRRLPPRWAPDTLLSDRVFISQTITSSTCFFACASKELKNDRDLALKAVERNGFALSYMNNKMNDDKEIVLAAVNNDPNALSYASEKLRNDKEVILKAINSKSYYKHAMVFEHVSEEMRNNKEVVFRAIITTRYNDINVYKRTLDLVGGSLRNDKTFILELVQMQGDALRCASEELRNDKEIVLAAATEHDKAFKYASKELKSDREFVLELIKLSMWWILAYVSDDLKNDRELILVAVKQNGFGLKYASDEFKNDKEIVLAAVNQTGFGLKYASEELKNDTDIVFAAVKQTGGASEYAGEELGKTGNLGLLYKEDLIFCTYGEKQRIKYIF